MDVVQFALLGIGPGAIYAVVAQGLVLVYRGSGILNLAQGAFAMVGAYAYYEFTVESSVPRPLGLFLAMVFCGVMGVVMHLLIIKPMVRSSPLSRVIATLAVLIILQSAAVLRYGSDRRGVPSWLPQDSWEIGDVTVFQDRLLLFAVGAVLTAGLWAAYRYTQFGRVAAAVAEKPDTAASLGHNPDLIAAANWGLGAALAGGAGALIAPIINLEPTQLVLLVLPAMAAALLGGFMSFPLAFLGAITIGVAGSLLQRYVDTPGWETAAPFLAVIAILVIQGRGLPLRSHVLDKLPAVGSGQIRVVPVTLFFVILGWIVWQQLEPDWAVAFTVTILFAIICLSIVVITGFAGQLSLAQYVLAGVGALLAARLSEHMGFVPALLLAVAITAAIGAVVGLPSLRTRGVTLAIVTLGLAEALFRLVLSNDDYNGGLEGITVDPPTVFGWEIDPLFYPERYALIATIALAVTAIAIANLRRGVIGRRMLAVRSNERASAALGVNIYAVKTYAFSLAAGVAALGGVLMAFMQISILPAQFAVFTGITLVGVTVAGGVGMIGGAFLGATLMPGGISSKLFHDVEDINTYLPLIGGIFLLLILRFGPDGLFEMNRLAGVHGWHQLKKVLPAAAVHTPIRARDKATAAVVAKLPALLRPKQPDLTTVPAARAPVAPKSLSIHGLRVTFGGVHAVDDFTLDLHPGEVHGLIGPNGAGKTTLIDAVTGFVRASAGTVQLDGVTINRWSPQRRAKAGVSRSFQSLELFSDLTVRENLAVACDEGEFWRYATDLVWPGRTKLSPTAVAAVAQCELGDDQDHKPENLSFGRRKLVAIARAVAAGPSVLLLDEPAAGLDDHEADELSGLIRTLARDWNIAVLLVEHNIDMVLEVCDRVTVMRSGKLLASGTPTEVRDDPAVLDAYLGTHAGAAPSSGKTL